MSKKFDLTTVYNDSRPMSWSALSSFSYNPNDWYRRYVLKEPFKPTAETTFGSYVDKKIQSDMKFLPSLERYPVMQYEMRATFDNIPLIGYADHWDPKRFRMKDDKTGRVAWTQQRADGTDVKQWHQFDFYLAMIYLTDKIKPENVSLTVDWMPTHWVDKEIAFIKENDIHTFHMARDMKQILSLLRRIKITWKEMEAYAGRQQQLLVHDRKDW